MTIWREWGSWIYEYFDLDTEPSVFREGEAFVELWRQKRGDQHLPKWSEYDWDDLFPWWGSLTLTELSWDPYDFLYRLYGTDIVRVFGTEVTGKRGSELKDGDYIVGYDMEFYEMVDSAPYLSRTSGPIHWQNRMDVHVEFIELPLSDSGDRATHCLSLMILPEYSSNR